MASANGGSVRGSGAAGDAGSAGSAGSFFKYCPSCASAALRFENGRRWVCPDCGFVYYHNVAASAAVVIDLGGSIVLLRRAKEPRRGRWALPGGFVDPGEGAQACALRECREEIGISWHLSPIVIGTGISPMRPATYISARGSRRPRGCDCPPTRPRLRRSPSCHTEPFRGMTSPFRRRRWPCAATCGAAARRFPSAESRRPRACIPALEGISWIRERKSSRPQALPPKRPE